MSRFKVTLTPQVLPGHCLTCGSPTSPEGFVDLDITIDYYGAALLCYRCVRALTESFGVDAIARTIITEDSVAQVLAFEESLKTLQEQVNANFDRLTSRMGSLGNYFAKCHALIAEAAEGHAKELGVRKKRESLRKGGVDESSGVGELGASGDDPLGIDA